MQKCWIILNSTEKEEEKKTYFIGKVSDSCKAFQIQWNHTALEIWLGGKPRKNIYKQQNILLQS